MSSLSSSRYLFQPIQLTALINSVGAVTLIASSAVNIAAGVALFLGMFALSNDSKNQSKAPQ